MASSMKYFLIIGFLHFLFTMADGSTINASTCNVSDVQTSLNAAVDGDTVVIPAGTCTWTQQVILTPAKAIIIQGAGIDITTIIDNVAKTSSSSTIWTINLALGKTFRLTGMTFQGQAQDTSNYNKGTVALQGNAHNFRVDHIKFFRPGTAAMSYSGDLWGVVDHSVFDLEKQGNIVRHENWNGQSFGDGSFADTLYLGTEKAIYFEDNTFIGSNQPGLGVLDSYAGGRFVFRYNTVTNDLVATHGTESSGRNRGVRSYEIYQNSFTTSAFMPWGIYLRGGTGVIWGNTFAGAGGQTGYKSAVQVANYRSDQSYSPWGQCTGSNAWDGNTSSTGYPCLDQVGRGTSDLLSGDPPIPVAWPHQTLDPVYVWNNTWIPVPNNPGSLVSQQNNVFQSGRDFFINVARPGYAPYTYPHPLTLGSSSRLSSPQNLTVIP